jgi:lipoprotein-releasing system permease protein
MNGFQEELRARILGVAAHVQITQANQRLSDWQELQNKVTHAPHVQAAAPFVMAQAMLSGTDAVQGTIVRGVLPEYEKKVSELSSAMKIGQLQQLKAGEFGIILGADLAQNLGVVVGDKITVMAPQGQVTPAGMVPRIKQFTLVGLFQIGMYEYDAGLALIHIEDAAKLFQMGDQVSGLRLKLDDLFLAPQVTHQLAETTLADYPETYYLTDWTQEHANFFRAVQMEKRVMFIILTLIVAVAAFNIVSTLVMAVADKRADIAILRTFGASPQSIMRIFVIQGAMIGFVGTVLGGVFGVLIALNIGTIVPFIEHLFHVEFLAKDVYYISELPSHLLWSDVLTIMLLSLGLSLLATLYPSWKASKMQAAEALRYD